MPRTVDISVPVNLTDQLVAEIQQQPGILSLYVYRAASLVPKGDAIKINITNDDLPQLMMLIDKYELGQTSTTSVSTSEPVTVISSAKASKIARDSSEAIWEEMEVISGKESNMTINAMVLMFTSGVLATIGITTNALHIVIGAMIIAPGFIPVSRIASGLVSGSAAWKRGLLDVFKGYAALAVGASLMTFIFMLMDKNPLQGESSYLPAGTLISYWTSITPSSLIVSVLASVAGALLIASNRTVLTGGVMIALALVPGATITFMALVIGEPSISIQGLMRWMIDAGMVFIFSFIVFLWKQKTMHKRRMVI